MAWHEVTTEDVMSEFTPAERNALKGIQEATDNLQPILNRVIARVRGCVLAGGEEVDEDNTAFTPDQLDGEVIAITRWRWLIAIGSAKSMQTEERKLASEKAEERLDKIAEGDLSVEPPDEGTTTPGGNWNSERKLIMRTHPVPTPLQQTGNDTGYANE